MDASTQNGTRARLRRVFAPRAFLLALVACTVGALAGSALPLPLVGGLGAVVGVFLAGFALGVLGPSRYVEVAVAGAAAAGLAFLVDLLVVSLAAGFTGRLAVVGAGSGVVAALLGHYFGRDLRGGLTREVN